MFQPILIIPIHLVTVQIWVFMMCFVHFSMSNLIFCLSKVNFLSNFCSPMQGELTLLYFFFSFSGTLFWMTQVPILPIMPTYRKIGHHLWMCPKNTPKIVRIHLPCPPRVRNALMTSSDQFLHSVLWFWTSFDKFEQFQTSLNSFK